jgi:hypothetical protein
VAVTKLRFQVEDASLELKRISERITPIGTEKGKVSCDMCKLSLNITEWISKAHSSRASMREFVTWKLESLLRHYRLKVLSFKPYFLIAFFRALTAKKCRSFS